MAYTAVLKQRGGLGVVFDGGAGHFYQAARVHRLWYFNGCCALRRYAFVMGAHVEARIVLICHRSLTIRSSGRLRVGCGRLSGIAAAAA